MRGSDKYLFGFHEKTVRVTCKNGKIYEGMCWAHSAIENEEEYDRAEASLDFCGVVVYISEIEKIEVIK